MDPMDPYKVLGLQRGASDEDVRKAFRDAASRLHPDRNPGDKAAEDAFKTANTAFQILSDTEKRTKWDRMNPVFTPPPTGFGGSSADSFNRAMEDLFKNHVPKSRERVPDADPFQTPVEGEDMHVAVSLTLKEAAIGCVKHVEARSPGHRVRCEDCDGSGCKRTGRRFPCSSCSGRGRKVSFGAGLNLGACQSCKGTGWTSPDKCEACKGTGRVPFRRSVNVTVPIGIADGQVLRLAGLGTPGVMSKPGDLFVTVRVSNDDHFRRDGFDMHVVRVLTLSEALMGGDVEVPTIDGGSVVVQVPNGAGPGRSSRIKGVGIRSPSNPSVVGDLIVDFQISMPERMSARARKLAEELSAELGKRDQAG